MQETQRPTTGSENARSPWSSSLSSPPFSYVGLDVFGPWLVRARWMRVGVANNKRWAVLFTCLTTRAIHIELIESMDTSSFINALCRFLALRGPVIQLRSDCGINSTGAYNELQSCVEDMNNPTVQWDFEWIFNSVIPLFPSCLSYTHHVINKQISL